MKPKIDPLEKSNRDLADMHAKSREDKLRAAFEAARYVHGDDAVLLRKWLRAGALNEGELKGFIDNYRADLLKAYGVKS